jgi:tetratricopeptide (TPR) repeat protein
MKNLLSSLSLCILALGLTYCSSPAGKEQESSVTADAPVEEVKEYQAISFLGDKLYMLEPSAKALSNLDSVRTMYEGDLSLTNLIWYGRYTAYAGDYKGSIDIFTEGLEQYPNDPWLLRHRGHRYISVRQLDKAIADLELGASLIAGQDDIVEPDGAPNAAGIPIGSLRSNMGYHLGLAYYLNGDYENSARVYGVEAETADNVDKLVSSTHWYYMSLRNLGRDEEAAAVVAGITADMHVIENFDYHKICLLYNGTTPVESMTIDKDRGAAGDALAYGIGNYHLYSGDSAKARTIFAGLMEGPVWGSFGHIAAEAHYSQVFK